MAQIIKVRCNGAGKHVNEVDLGEALRPTKILRGVKPTAAAGPEDVPERMILRCRECADGKVILTRAMVEDARQRNSS